MHDVSVVTVFDTAEYAAGLADVGDTCFILMNTRSLPEAAAGELTTAVAGDHGKVPPARVGAGCLA